MKKTAVLMAFSAAFLLAAAPIPRSTPEKEGMPSAAVDKMLDRLENEIEVVDSVIVTRNNRIICEKWFRDNRPENLHVLWSLTKNFTSTAVGFAVQDGLLSIDDQVITFFPDELPETVSDRLASLTVRDLLMQRPGWSREDLEPIYKAMFEPDEDTPSMVKAMLEARQTYRPGEFFIYQEAAPTLLSAIVGKVTGKPLDEYLNEKLFMPLGIENYTWEKEKRDGVCFGGFGLSLATEDLAKFGLFLLNNGSWEGRQLLNPEWIAEASAEHGPRPGAPAEKEDNWTQGYGYLFWRNRFGGYRGDGAAGQYNIVIPELNMTIAMTGKHGDLAKPMDIVAETVVSALVDEKCCYRGQAAR